jgi:hypothetical protein
MSRTEDLGHILSWSNGNFPTLANARLCFPSNYALYSSILDFQWIRIFVPGIESLCIYITLQCAMSIHPLLSVQQTRSRISVNVFGLGFNSTTTLI